MDSPELLALMADKKTAVSTKSFSCLISGSTRQELQKFRVKTDSIKFTGI